MEQTKKFKKSNLYWLFLFIMIAIGIYFLALSIVLMRLNSFFMPSVSVILGVSIAFSNYYAYLIGLKKFEFKLFLDISYFMHIAIIFFSFMFALFLTYRGVTIDGVEQDLSMFRYVFWLGIANSIIGYIVGRIDREKIELSEN